MPNDLRCALPSLLVPMVITSFSLVFVATVALTLGLRLTLARRQIRHVLAHRQAVPVEFSARVALAAHQKAADYTAARSRFGMGATLMETLVLLAFTLGGGIETLHQAWSGWLGPDQPLLYGLALIGSVAVISAVIDLPLAYYRQFVLEQRFGFNRMTPPLFFADLGKSLALGAAIGGPLLLAVLWLMASTGKNWWIHVWLFWTGFNLLLLFVYPTWIAPLFNKFTPLEAGELKSRIEALLARCGFSTSGLFVMDGSKRSAHGNAYFTGLGKNKRIVFFDTLLSRLTPVEAEAVLAHELGHFKRHHVTKRMILIFTLSLVFLWALGQLMQAQWFYEGLGVSEQNTALALLLFFMVAPVFTFVLTPLSSLLSRRHEYEADAYAVAHADGQQLVTALVKLYEDNASTLTPDPMHSLFYDSHPPAALRIAHIAQLADRVS